MVQLGNSVTNPFFQFTGAPFSSFFFIAMLTIASTQILLANNEISKLGFWVNYVTGCVCH